MKAVFRLWCVTVACVLLQASFACGAQTLWEGRKNHYILGEPRDAGRPRYVAVQLDAGPFGDAFVSATAINAAGDIAGGVTWRADGVDYVYYSGGFRYVGGVMEDLRPTLGLVGLAIGIGDHGEITGQMNIDGTQCIFVYDGHAVRVLETPSDLAIDLKSVSGNGQMTGHIWELEQGVNRYTAIRYANGLVEGLGTLGGQDSFGYGINDAGDVTGWSQIADGYCCSQAFIYTDGTMRPLGVLDGPYSAGYAINAARQVTGSASVRGASHAFLYSDGRMEDLGTLHDHTCSYGVAINARGEVIGSSGGDCFFWERENRAFLYSNGTMYDLNALVESGLDGYTLSHADGINDRGQIAATGRKDGVGRAFRLDPVR